MLQFLEGISPIWWLVAALILGAIEMLSPTTYLLWLALSALAVGGSLALFPELSGEVQAALFAVFAIAFTVAGRYLIPRFGRGRDSANSLNEPANRVVGQVAEVISFEHGEGRIMVNGVRWHARSRSVQDLEPGMSVRIVAAEGATLLIERLEDH